MPMMQSVYLKADRAFLRHMLTGFHSSVIVVPGIAGPNLNERTCPHFSDWLDRAIADCKSCARSWVYKHSLEIDKLESWDLYSSTGEDLLAQLLLMQSDKLFVSPTEIQWKYVY